MSHAVILPLTNDTELVITSDNSGAIGEKPGDVIHVSNIDVGYYAARVAMMELLAVGGSPQTIIMQNFTSDNVWSAYKDGVMKVLDELKFKDIVITGSTETNFKTIQSCLGITFIGIRSTARCDGILSGDESFAVIGTPLVGNEVTDLPNKIAPLSLFYKFSTMSEVLITHPVGSKGILADLRLYTKKNRIKATCELDIHKSAGPATCFIISFSEKNRNLVKKIAGEYFFDLNIA